MVSRSYGLKDEDQLVNKSRVFKLDLTDKKSEIQYELTNQIMKLVQISSKHHHDQIQIENTKLNLKLRAKHYHLRLKEYFFDVVIFPQDNFYMENMDIIYNYIYGRLIK